MYDANDFSEEFDHFWLEICDYANTLGVSPRYIEEEFCIEGELVKMGQKVKTKVTDEDMFDIITGLPLDDTVDGRDIITGLPIDDSEDKYEF